MDRLSPERLPVFDAIDNGRQIGAAISADEALSVLRRRHITAARAVVARVTVRRASEAQELRFDRGWVPEGASHALPDQEPD